MIRFYLIKENYKYKNMDSNNSLGGKGTTKKKKTVDQKTLRKNQTNIKTSKTLKTSTAIT